MGVGASAGCALVAAGGLAALLPRRGRAARAAAAGPGAAPHGSRAAGATAAPPGAAAHPAAHPGVTLAFALQLAGLLLLAVAAVALVVSGDTVGAPFSGAVRPAFGLDPLSAFFLLVVALAALPALPLARDQLRTGPHAGALAALTAAFLLALVCVVAARDVVTFLAGWELMTLLPASAIVVARRDRRARHAVFVYLAISHVGGAGVWVALLALAHAGALDGAAPSGGLQAFVAIAALFGFGTKAGLMPLHAWLPRAHPIAPGHVSALMSAAMLKVALYGLVRVLFGWDGPAPLWVGLVLLALGVVSALGGVLYALVQRELKRLLAFSSIENVGVIALGLGAAIVLGATGATAWSALAFAAALLHTLNHAVFKSLLFLAAAAFSRAVGALELDRLGGLLRRMPWSGWAFLVGCAAIAGLPPLSGFASEWMTLQALSHVGAQSSAGVALAGAAALAGLAATAALAAFCFVKVAGLALLGGPRSPRAAMAVEQPPATRAGLALGVALSVAGGLTPGLLVPSLVRLAPGGEQLPTRLGLDLPGTGGLPVVGIAVALALAVVLLRLAAGSGRDRSAAPAPVWACGQRVEPALAWTSAGFTKPLRLVLESVLRPRREVTVRRHDGIVTGVAYRAEVPHLFDTLLYGPLQRAALRGAAVARRLQSGSVRAYVAYLLLMTLALLALVRLGAFA
jgi:hydrogenase-4 component B